MIDVSIVIPTRNAERLIGECLTSVIASEPREVIVVDGMSTDRTLEIVESHGVRLLSDEGLGLPFARSLGARTAQCDRVVLIDADVVVPPGALQALLKEYEQGRYDALQAGLDSTSGEGYWGRALAEHHRSGRSKRWFGVVCTIFDRQVLLAHGFDARFVSGEDIELRLRLQQSGARIGVSRQVFVTHRFAEDSFEFARSQWIADGRGLGRLLRKQGWRAGWVLALPAAAAGRGTAVSALRRQPRWIPYYLAYAAYNYRSIVGGWRERSRQR